MEMTDFVRKVIEDKNRFDLEENKRRMNRTVEVIPNLVIKSTEYKPKEPFRKEVYGVKNPEARNNVDFKVDMGIANNLNSLMVIEEKLKHNFKTNSMLVRFEMEQLSEEILLNGKDIVIGESLVMDVSFERELLMRILPEESVDIIIEVVFILIHKNFTYDKMVDWIRMELKTNTRDEFVNDYLADRDFKPTMELVISYLSRKVRSKEELIIGWISEDAMATAPYNKYIKN